MLLTSGSYRPKKTSDKSTTDDVMMHVANVFNNVIVFWTRHTFLGASGSI